MKINWGTAIVLVLAIFLVGMMTLVIISSSQQINLVTPDYYPEGIDYQNMIEKQARTAKLTQGVIITQNNGSINVKFPAIDSLSNPEGKIHLFFPIDYRLDKKYQINVDTSLTQYISKDSLIHGTRCTIKVDWKQAGQEFYSEETIMLN